MKRNFFCPLPALLDDNYRHPHRPMLCQNSRRILARREEISALEQEMPPPGATQTICYGTSTKIPPKAPLPLEKSYDKSQPLAFNAILERSRGRSTTTAQFTTVRDIMSPSARLAAGLSASAAHPQRFSPKSRALSASACTFRPEIHQRSRGLPSRSLADLSAGDLCRRQQRVEEIR